MFGDNSTRIHRLDARLSAVEAAMREKPPAYGAIINPDAPFQFWPVARNSAVLELRNQIGALETRLKRLECPHERVRECVTKSVPEYEIVYADADKPREEWTRCPLSPTTRMGSWVVKTCLDCGKEIGNDFVPDEEA